MQFEASTKEGYFVCPKGKAVKYILRFLFTCFPFDVLHFLYTSDVIA
jgi:hypothetical protein